MSRGLEALARAVLYEGYALYPYRASSAKNRHRFLFGTLYPPSFAAVGGERSSLRTECLMEGTAPSVDIRVCFLQPTSARGSEDWQRVVERSLSLELDASRAQTAALPFSFASDAAAGIWPLEGLVSASMTALGAELHRLTVRVENGSTWTVPTTASREEALLRALVSTQTLLRASRGEFVSATDPPARLRDEAAACRCEGAWPVLVGDAGSRAWMLSSPIILGDYPAVAPESPHDLFDSTEIDEILTLRVLTLTEGEKEEMRRSDPRAASLLDRVEGLEPSDLARLHGRLSLERGWSAGDRVRLLPRGNGDVLDLALAGQDATVVGVEQTFEGDVFLAVTVDADPGRDLGEAGMMGHRFFYRPEEVARR